MKYRFTVREDHRDLASGRVLRSAPGIPAFPVRLASEIFQQARADRGEAEGRLTVLDPLAGAGHLLAVLGILHGMHIERLIAVDIDPSVVGLAQTNLALTTTDGLSQRSNELLREFARTGNLAHAAGADSAERLVDRVSGRHGCEQAVLTGDATDPGWVGAHLDAQSVDLVITDVPYGGQAGWRGNAGSLDPADAVAVGLDAWRPVMADGGVAVVVNPKEVRPRMPAGWTRHRHATLGHRRISYFHLTRESAVSP